MTSYSCFGPYLETSSNNSNSMRIVLDPYLPNIGVSSCVSPFSCLFRILLSIICLAVSSSVSTQARTTPAQADSIMTWFCLTQEYKDLKFCLIVETRDGTPIRQYLMLKAAKSEKFFVKTAQIYHSIKKIIKKLCWAISGAVHLVDATIILFFSEFCDLLKRFYPLNYTH